MPHPLFLTLPTKQKFFLPLPSLALLLARTQKVMHIPVLLPSAVCAGEVGNCSLSLFGRARQLNIDGLELAAEDAVRVAEGASADTINRRQRARTLADVSGSTTTARNFFLSEG